MTRFLKTISLILVISMLCSCSMLKQELPQKKQVPFEQYVWVNNTFSSYGYNQLDDNMKQIYTDIKDAWMNFSPSVTTKKADASDVNAIMMNILRDYPIIFWVNEKYTYRNNITGTTINFEYTMDKQKATQYVSQLNDKTALLLQDISPSLSDFEKAVLAHDKLIEAVSYDRNAEFQDQAYGAIVNEKAACQGYSKAYQLLLLKMGIESIIVFGQANEPHAWNLVKLDDDFYFVDVTFDDRELSSGGNYLSREYLFLTDEQSIKTHTPSGNGARFSLPDCKATKYNYFLNQNLIIDSDEKNLLLSKVKDTAKQAIEKRETSFQIKIASNELQEKINSKYIANGVIDNSISIFLSKYNGVNYLGRTFEKDTNVHTFLLEYK